MKATNLLWFIALSFVTLVASEDDPDAHKGKHRTEDLSQQSPDQLKEKLKQNDERVEEYTGQLAKATAELQHYLQSLHLPQEHHKKGSQ